MDIKKYIKSGILEQYVVGNLFSDMEVREVEKNAIQYPEIKAEITKIEEVLEWLAGFGAITPPEGLKEKILARIEPRRPKQAPPIALASSSGNVRSLYFASGILLLCLFGALTFAFAKWQAAGTLGNNLDKLTKEYAALEEDCNEIKKENEKQGEIIEYMNDYNTIHRKIGNSDNNYATLHWNAEQSKALLEFSNIDEDDDIPPDKQYELWSIGEKGPESMGVVGSPILSGSFGDFVAVPFLEDSTLIYAITLEDFGGSPTGKPSLDELRVIEEKS